MRDVETRALSKLTRRRFLGSVAAAGAASVLRGAVAARPETETASPHSGLTTRPIPSSRDGERLPLVGLGSWITFNVGDDRAARDSCAEVMRAFFAEGGRLVDSSPMYGSSQEVIGYGLGKLGRPSALFSADKVWTPSDGPEQIEESRRRWGVPRFDLLEVHNALSWEKHLPALLAMKAAGKLRYVGVTTSEGRRHDEIEKILRTQPIDFVQVTYNAADREVEDRILPLARERRVAVICNRPFRRGELTERAAKAPLPAWASEIDCSSWAQILLKFIVAHPAVACAIPATTRVDHVRENVRASSGRMPDETTRRRIAAEVAKL